MRGLVGLIALAGAVAYGQSTTFNIGTDGSITAEHHYPGTSTVVTSTIQNPYEQPTGGVRQTLSPSIPTLEGSIRSMYPEIVSFSSPTEYNLERMGTYAQNLTDLAVQYYNSGRTSDIAGTVIPRLGELAEKYYLMAKNATGTEQTRLYTECVERCYEAFTRIFGEEKWLEINLRKESKDYLDFSIAVYLLLGKDKEAQKILPTYKKVKNI